MSTKVFRMKSHGTMLDAPLIGPSFNNTVFFGGKYYKLNYPKKTESPYGTQFVARYFVKGATVYVNFKHINAPFWYSYWRFAPIAEFEGLEGRLSLTKRYI